MYMYMGGVEGWVQQQQQQQPSGFCPNGLLPDEVASVTRKLDPERWVIAEERIAELIACIQPNQPSEERRIAVASYVQRLITKCFPCQAFTFGSVPLKTYLPDGDIDLTAFSNSQNLKETWANEVKDILEREEKSANAEFRVKEVQYIQAEVKIIKCLVENIVVDISFNQLGGLCTLCFLEEVDRLINQNHLFKCSIILIKAWCYYESRILGAHHGLISTYALETLVLYIFHVFNCSFAGPLEVLYRFLEFFSRFDWENYCISLSGPVPISSLPDMTADPPRKDNGELLLSKLFLDECSNVYSYLPGRQDNQEQAFILKYFNVIDPLRTNNNLGRSVSKGNFFRIRSAFAFGAQRLARLLDCPKENLLVELNRFFTNTWDRHGNGHRPDVPSPNLFSLHNAKQTSITQVAESVVTHSALAFDGTSSQAGIYNMEQTSRSVDISSVSHIPVQKTPSNLAISKASHANNQTSRFTSSNENVHSEKGRDSRADYMGNEAHIRYQFPRTHSSPELKDASIEAPSRGRRNKTSDTGHGQVASVRLDNTRSKNVGSDVLESHGARFSTENSSKHSSSHQRFDASSTSNGYNDDAGAAVVEDPVFLPDTTQLHQEVQDHVNMIPPFNPGGQGHISANLTSNHPLFPVPPSILASLGYAQKGLTGSVPPSFQPSWASATQYSQCFVPFPVSQYVPNLGRMSNKEERTELGTDNLLSTEVNYEDTHHGLWSKHGADSLKSDHHSRGFQAPLHEDTQQFRSVDANPSCSSHVSSSGSFSMGDHRFIAEDQGPSGENHSEKAQFQRTKDVDAPTSTGLRFVPASQASSSGIKVSSEDSRDAPSKTTKSSRARRGRIPASPSEISVSNGMSTNGWQYEDKSGDHSSSPSENDNRGWIPLSKGGSEKVVSADVPSHVWNRQMPGYDMASVRESTSVLPVERADDNHGALPYAFYPTGPPVPFLAMLPIYNVPNETEASTVSTNTFTRNEGSNTSQYSQSDHNLESTEGQYQSEIIDSSSVKDASSMELPRRHRSDILNGDFVSHWQNLQYGRYCQSAQFNGSLLYPSSVVPPMYLQGHFPWDSSGKPAANFNIFAQLMNNTPQLIPVSPLHHGSSIPAGVRQHYAEEIPRYRSGTGTYLPNPKASARARQSSNTRNNRANYSSDRKDRNGDRDGNWNNNSKSRFSGRSQVERSSVMMDRSTKNRHSERPWNSKQNSLSPYYSRNGSFSFSNSANRGSPSPNMAYNMYPVPFVNPSGISSSGSAVPSVVMLYPYDQNMGYSSSGEHLEFGSFGPVRLEVSGRGINEKQDTRGDSDCSSPDQPSSPQVHRPV